MIEVFIAFGSNLNEPLQQLRRARSALKTVLQEQVASSLYQTAPQGYAHQPDFINGVIQYQTDLSPEALLQQLQALETAAGRQRSFANAPRPLDLDLLLYGTEALDLPDLIVPHPRMLQRDFVMIPLAEIAPERLIANKKAAAWAADFAPLKRFLNAKDWT